jgi:hypothetical protein
MTIKGGTIAIKILGGIPLKFRKHPLKENKARNISQIKIPNGTQRNIFFFLLSE